MVTINLHSPPGRKKLRRESPRGTAAVSNGKAHSELTIWLLAVRDQRDRAAFAALFDHLAPRLKGFVIRSGASSALAEEIVQDVMLTIWRKAAQFDPHKAQASAWIYQITRNRHIDIVRKEHRPVPDELGADPGLEPDASQMLGLEQEAERLKLAIQKLQPDQKEMIEKAYIGELTHQEISSQTGLRLGTVKSRIRLGLERLRKELKGLR
ncbi:MULTISPECIES: sigma-70 family RNA polymerase sigma factor [unclassified Leisingera]|uniref:sigma-70 family RNA polymerase sigma factor n=1 Tax=Leisingera sp. NJS204 TaxID=2508307 RepID=UPI0010107293|nr:sigma-70 family RNA polymerase sigma factor [Leisingera sp. MMG026]QAX28178.1 sigma-70 family RNA polymerase sigma factor [Leisingera sp. NJS204]